LKIFCKKAVKNRFLFISGSKMGFAHFGSWLLLDFWYGLV